MFDIRLYYILVFIMLWHTTFNFPLSRAQKGNSYHLLADSAHFRKVRKNTKMVLTGFIFICDLLN